MVARPSRARAKPRSLYDEQAEELRKKGVELQTQDDDEENEEQDDDRSATFVAEPTQKKARARTGAVAKPRTNAAPKQATALFKAVSAAKQEKGAALLTRFAFECCGAVDAKAIVGDSLDEDADDAAWTQLLTSLGDQLGSKATPRAYPLHPTAGRGDAFEERFRGAWAEVVDASARGDRGAYEETAISLIVDVLTCNAASFDLDPTDRVDGVRAALGSSKTPKKGSKAETCQQTVDDLEEARTKCDEALDELFEGVFSKRYRDSKPEVRAAVVKGLVGWVQARPSKFAATKYLKYAAWVLDFQDGAAVRASGARVLAAAFACAGDQKDTLRDFALRFAPRLGEMAHDVDPDCQAAAIQALRALKDCGLLDELELADIRSDALAFALDLEEFDANTSQGDAQRSLRDLGRFVEASVLGDDGPTTLTSLAADAFLALPERASLLRDWRAWVALLQRDDVDAAASQENQRLVDVLLRLCARSAETDSLSAAPALLEALPALLTKYGGDDDLLQTVCALGESASQASTKDARYVKACKALLDRVATTSDDASLNAAAKAIRAFSANSTDKKLSKAVSKCISEAAKPLLEEPAGDNDAVEAALMAAVKRIQALAQAVDVPAALSGGAALAEALAARAAQLADDGDVNAKACLEALGALVLWRAKACLDNIDDAGDAEPLDPVITACADGAARALACRYEAPTLALKGGDLHDLELREDDENTMQVTRAALDVVAVLAAAAHPGLKERQGLESMALPVETDAQLCSLVADACRRGDVSLEPCAHVAAAAPPETPARTDLWAAVVARAAKDDADLLPSLSSRLAGTGPDDVARVHLKALEAETLDQVTAKALAKSLVKAAATRADRADALHALLHAGVDAALADAPSTLILLGALRPYVDAAQPKRRGKDAEADSKVDRALVASVRDACAARASVIRRDADDDENWDLLDAFEGALGTHAPAKKKAPPAPEEEEPWDAPAEPPKLPKAKSPPRRRAPPARRGSGYRSALASSLSEPLEKIAEASDEDSDDGGAALLQRRSQDDVPDDLSAVSSLKDDDQAGSNSRKRKPHPLSPIPSAPVVESDEEPAEPSPKKKKTPKKSPPKRKSLGR
ncbi:unnamed protein product [Pelagomonas calceolata]|uniref:SCD domain-containing protein n=1 Tax=Pelagomonas calceolata TaxID=35677 RepID=A0A8J2WVM4_9STRA|nr:unnamed protein product [Pelagomonas calceolata]